MKKNILLIGGYTQPNAGGFIKEFALLGGKVDAVICLQPEKNIKYWVKSLLRGLKRLRGRNLKQNLRTAFGKTIGAIPLSAVKKSWENTGENSWNLLESSLNLFEYAKNEGIPFYHALFLSKKLLDDVTKGEPSLIMLYSGGILSEELINIPNIEFINAHMGEMPRYRGMNVLEWAVLEEQPTKVCVMTMNKAIDGGDVIYTHDISLNKEKTIRELRRTGYIECYKAMAKGIFDYSRGHCNKIAQAKGARYYYRMHPLFRAELAKKLSNR